VKVYFMRVENVYPDYKDALEREKRLQDAYTELQLIFYNKEKGSKKNSAISDNRKNIDFKKKGN